MKKQECLILCCAAVALMLICFGTMVTVREYLDIGELITRPKRHVLVLVMSARGNFEARQAIRETWGKDIENVYFTVGRHWCDIPPNFQDSASPCKLDQAKRDEVGIEAYTSAKKIYNEEQEKITHLLEEEQAAHSDMILLDTMDSYGNLAAKVRDAFLFGLTFPNASHCDWFMKVDDDVVMIPENFKALVQSLFTTKRLRIVGNIVRNGLVQAQGKWAEHEYNAKFYPDYPQGASGYLITRKVANKMKQNGESFIAYHNEDASLGIWVSRMNGEKVYMQNSPVFCPDCLQDWCETLPLSNLIRHAVIGHKYSPEGIRKCYRRVKYPLDLLRLVRKSNATWFDEIEGLPNALDLVQERIEMLRLVPPDTSLVV